MNDKDPIERGNHIVDLIANSTYMLQLILVILKVFRLENLTWLQTLAPMIAAASLGILIIVMAIVTSSIEDIVRTITKKR